MTHRIFCDFDGTISRVDATDLLLEAFADPGWREIENQWRAGAIGSATCMARQVALLRCCKDDLDALLDTVAIDPAFGEFVGFCRRIGAELTVVSDGLDYVIERALGKVGILDVPIVANHLVFLNDGSYAMLSPHASPECRVAAGTCKCAAASARDATGLTVLIGDGRSDFCAAEDVDFVLAKDALFEFCRRELIPHDSFADFSDVAALLTARIVETSTVAAQGGRMPERAEN